MGGTVSHAWMQRRARPPEWRDAARSAHRCWPEWLHSLSRDAMRRCCGCSRARCVSGPRVCDSGGPGQSSARTARGARRRQQAWDTSPCPHESSSTSRDGLGLACVRSQLLRHVPRRRVRVALRLACSGAIPGSCVLPSATRAHEERRPPSPLDGRACFCVSFQTERSLLIDLRGTRTQRGGTGVLR